MSFHQALADALTPIVGRIAIPQPVGPVEENRCEIRFPDTLYWLVIEDDATVMLVHRCIIAQPDNVTITINPTSPVIEIAQQIDNDLFRRIPTLTQAVHPTAIRNTEGWDEAFRRRALLDLWSKLEELPSNDFVKLPITIPFPVYEKFIPFTVHAVKHMEDEAVSYCLGYLSALLDRLTAEGECEKHGIANWHDHFLGKDLITERTEAEAEAFANDPIAWLINVMPLSVLKHRNMV